MIGKRKIKSRTLHLLYHLLFWSGAYLVFVFVLGRIGRDVSTIFYLATPLFPFTILISYMVNRFLVPRFLLKKRYGLFVTLLFITLCFLFWFEMILFIVGVIFIGGNSVEHCDLSTLDVPLFFFGQLFFVLIATGGHSIHSLMILQRENSEIIAEKLRSEIELKEMKLRLLKAQLHPHFLFNTLNNIYGLALEQSEETAPMVLQISELLDYILYESDKKRVLLCKELEIVEKYINLERARFDDRLTVQNELHGEVAHQTIAPLLLFPFFENAFKHGLARSEGSCFLHSTITCSANSIHFRIENSKPVAPIPKRGSGGIGLQNVRDRLQLLYPNRFELLIEDEGDRFVVGLQIDGILKDENNDQEN